VGRDAAVVVESCYHVDRRSQASRMASTTGAALARPHRAANRQRNCANEQNTRGMKAVQGAAGKNLLGYWQR
jgi:hypothetical protein